MTKNTAKSAGTKRKKHSDQDNWAAHAIKQSLEEEQDDKLYQKYIAGLTQFLRCEFFLQIYNVDFIFDDPDCERTQHEATIEINDVYSFCTIRLSKQVRQNWKDRKHEKVVFAICHELFHVVLEPMAKRSKDYSPSEQYYMKDEWEKITQQIAKIYMSRVDRRLFDPAFVEKYRTEQAVEIKPFKKGGEKIGNN